MRIEGSMPIDVVDHPDAEHAARPAATVVLVRDGADELEVLMIHRGADTAFGGMWAFPGGAIEPDDVPIGTEPDPLPAARAAAARETREEIGLHVDPGSFVWWSHWLPPGRNALSVRRFSTWFFVAPAHDGHADEHVGVDGNEVHAHLWVPPAVALAMQERGEIELAPPTYVTLTQLARYGDVGSALAAADPAYFATEIYLDGAIRHCLWAGDVGYGGGDPRADGPRHRLVMDDAAGWHYLNTADPDAGRLPPGVRR
jgi:8-oxo-dGTP pyrophosphatase MutT (NUDIX family)